MLNNVGIDLYLIVSWTKPKDDGDDGDWQEGGWRLTQWSIDSYFEQFFALKLGNISPL